MWAPCWVVNRDLVEDYFDAIEREELNWSHQGIIREKNKRGEKMDEVVDGLLAEMKEAEEHGEAEGHKDAEGQVG